MQNLNAMGRTCCPLMQAVSLLDRERIEMVLLQTVPKMFNRNSFRIIIEMKLAILGADSNFLTCFN
jgi:hypothetical protein